MPNTEVKNQVSKLTDVVNSIIEFKPEQVDDDIVELMNIPCPVVCPICGSTEFEVDDDPGMAGGHDRLCLKYYCTECTYTWSEQYDICLD